MIELAWEQDSDGEEPTCAICLDAPAAPTLVAACCAATFCESCLVPWVTRRGNSCPVCRGRAVDEHTVVDGHVLVVPDARTRNHSVVHVTAPPSLRLRVVAGALTCSSVIALSAGFYKFVEVLTS